MKKKISILLLAALFVVSTTGLSVTINLCKMADVDNGNECMMHHKPIKSHCCMKENSEFPVTVSFDNYDCCESEFVFNKVEDEFLYNKTDVNFFSSLEHIIQPVSLIPQTVDYSFNESFFCDSSPPFLINPELHITNSILLI